MNVRTFYTSPIETNTYICHNDGSSEAIAIDVGEYIEDIKKYLIKNKLILKYIILTHGHFDHIAGVADMLEEHSGAKVIMHSEDTYLIRSHSNMGYTMGIDVKPFNVDIVVEDGNEIEACGSHIKFMHTPGHTKGSMSIIADRNIFSGDTLFYTSYGRVDFPGGNFPDMENSLKNKLFKLEGDYKVYPGHGITTSLNFEREHNEILHDFF